MPKSKVAKPKEEIVPAPEADVLQLAMEMTQLEPSQTTASKVLLGGHRFVELTEWNGSKRVDIRIWKDDTIPTKEGVSLNVMQWKALTDMAEVIDDLLTRIVHQEPVDWRCHLGEDVYVTVKAPYRCVNIRKFWIPQGEWTFRPTKKGVALNCSEWKELLKTMPMFDLPETRPLMPLTEIVV